MPIRWLASLAATLVVAVGGSCVAAEAPRELALADALRLAHMQGRNKTFQDEELRLLARDLGNRRADYGPQLNGRLVAGVSGTVGDAHPVDDQSAVVGASQALPTGGSFSLITDTARTHSSSSEDTVTGLTALVRQPLLRGAGVGTWREALTRTERAYVYALRAHEQFRENLTLGIAQTYWSLQKQQNALSQYRAAVIRREFLHQQTQAMVSIGKAALDEAFRAEVELLNARQQSLDAEAAYAAAGDAFKFELNLPIEQPIAIANDPPDSPRFTLDTAAAIATAFAKRLDWFTAANRVEDSRRLVRLSRRDLLPQLDVEASLTYAGSDDHPWADTLGDEPDYRVALSLEIPFDRRDERLSYERALVGVTRAQRDLERLRQEIIQDVYDDARALQKAKTTRLIQDRSRVQSRNRLEKAQIDYKAGRINNRDLLEAQENIRSAETQYYAALSDYRAAELKLRRDTGLLTIDKEGLWADAWPAYLSIAEDR